MKESRNEDGLLSTEIREDDLDACKNEEVKIYHYIKELKQSICESFISMMEDKTLSENFNDSTKVRTFLINAIDSLVNIYRAGGYSEEESLSFLERCIKECRRIRTQGELK